MEQNPLVSRPLPVLFGQFVGPAMVAMVLDGIQGMVDGLFLGHYAGPDAMASVNIANPFFQIIIGSTMILCTGTMSAAGRALGAQDYSRAKNLYRSALAVLLALSGTILLTGVLFARPIARFLGGVGVAALNLEELYCIDSPAVREQRSWVTRLLPRGFPPAAMKTARRR